MDIVQQLPNIARLLNSEKPIKIGRGETISDTEQFKHLWYIKDGVVKRFQILNNGGISVQGLYGSGDAFSLSYVFQKLFDRKLSHGPETYYYEVMCDATLFRIPGDKLKDCAEKDPKIYKDLLILAGNRLASNIQILENQGLADAHRQVAHLLAHYARRYGQKIDGSYTINLPLTQQDLADVLGLTRETVSTCINHLKQHGFVADKSHPIIIINLEELTEFAFS